MAANAGYRVRGYRQGISHEGQQVTEARTRSGDLSDTELGRVVVDKNLASADEVAECVALKKQLAAENKARTLVELLVEKGVCTERQIRRVAYSMEETRSAQAIPGYRLISKLGSGAMATVYKARQLSLDREVAIKILPKRYSDDPEYVERFYKEGQAAAKLNHPNIVQAIDVGEAGGYHFFVMEYVEGHTLYDELAKGRAFPEEEALRIIIQIARALAHAHERGLIHRDVKPKNIMITKDGTAKLADMGLARLAADQQAAQAEAGRAFGTPYYISPEQIRGELNIDFRADIYSLGATLYHLVTGRVPFEGPTPAAVMHKHLREPLIPPDHLNTSLSVGMGEVVEVMMAKRPQDRYASTKDLLVDLEAIARHEPPLQVRKTLGASDLKALTRSEPSEVEQPPPQAPPPALALSTIDYALIALLAVSILINIIQALL
jgi:serine/threonine-protein kinase